ncbi:uncharacterized protein LOC110051025, partial [Orbicella faveolata]|uniref:uncharacterized protein LOC110051025 n=1 Tax=Orbicella faveolata TaxID=48498 RepID=UPI0009E64DB6
HHHDKSTLSSLSDTVHQKLNNDKYFSMKQHMLAAITEKKVEIWHSLLRDSIEWDYTAPQIRLNAQLLSVNKIQHEFCHHFVPEYQRGTGERDHTLLARRSAEFIIEKLQLIAKNLVSPKQVPRQIGQNGKLLGEPKYQLPSFGNTIIDALSLPLAYSHDKIKQNREPKSHVMCDFPNCNTEGTQQITRLACFHTCHRLCLENNGNSCPICKDRLLKRITDLSDTFNSGLLETKDNSPAINETNEQSTSQADITTTTGRNAEFYKSHEWENFISTSFEQLVIPQPSVLHTTTREPTQTTGSTSTSQRQNHCSHCGRPGHRKSRGA